MPVRARLMGPPRVVDGLDEHPLRATLQGRALAYLAYTGAWEHRDRLAFLFWPDVPDDRARHNVRQLVKRIRRLAWLRGIEVEDERLRWSVETDVDALRVGGGHLPADLLAGLPELLPGLERGGTLEYVEWLEEERRRLRERWQSAVVRAADSVAARGDRARGAALLAPLLDIPGGEVVLPSYMEYASGSGDRLAAVRAYDRVSTRLRIEEDRPPPESAQELASRLRGGEPAAQGDSAGEPVPSGRVVARADEVAGVTSILAREDCRLLTLLGPGGIGKSTLARLVADAASSRSQETAVVSLESLADASAVADRIAVELGVRTEGPVDAADQLAGMLQGRDMLLVLDDVEHLSQAWVLFSRLVHDTDHLVLLVTSRVRLGLAEEWVHEVGGLRLHESLELLAVLCRRLGVPPPSPEEATAIHEAVGGSPLGIELSAPWLRTVSGAEVASMIRADTEVLGGGPLDAAHRHRSVSVAMAHSWELASVSDRRAVEALSVFAAPCSADLAAAVADAAPPVLRRLVDMSLVQRRTDGRFASHPLVRGHAEAQLRLDPGRHRAVLRRHSRAVLERVTSTTTPRPDLADDAVVALEHVVEEHDWAAVAAAADGVMAALRAAGQLRTGLQLVRSAVRRLGTAPAGVVSGGPAARLHVCEAYLLDDLGRHAEAVDAATRAVDAARRAGDGALLAGSLMALARAQKTIGGDEVQYRVAREAQAVADSDTDTDPRLQVDILNALGCSAPDLVECRDHLRAGLGICRRERLGASETVLSANLGAVLVCLGEGERGRSLIARAVERAREEGHRPLVVEFLADLAWAHAQVGDLDEAARCAEEAEDLLAASESGDLLVYTTVVAGEVALMRDDPAGARRRAGLALRWAHELGNEALLLRSLRLHAQLLLQQGDEETGLGVLALVVTGPTRKGDFTSEVINPRLWAQHTVGVAPEELAAARDWARVRSPLEVAAGLVDAGDGGALKVSGRRPTDRTG